MSLTLKEIAARTGTTLVGDPDYVITGVADLLSATPTDISFLGQPKYAKDHYRTAALESKAGALFVSPSFECKEGGNFLLSEDPTTDFQKAIGLFRGNKPLSTFSGVHPTAIVHESVKVGKEVTIGPYAVIESEVEIGAHTHISPHVYIGPRSKIGSHCLIHPQVTVREDCTIGDRVILQPGAVIGACGFGYSTDREGHHHKLDHVGTVIIEDDVEIGASSTIDRARFKETRIGRGSKIDNLVLIAHNVCLGPNNIVAGQTGIAGSTTTGRLVVMGGQVGVDGHLHIGDGVILTGRTGVSKSLPPGGRYGGAPAMELSQHNRLQVTIRKLPQFIEEIKKRLADK